MLYAKVTNPTAGYTHDREKIKILSYDTYYPASVSMGGSNTSVFIHGYPGGFNSVNFTFYKKRGEKFVEHSIFDDPYYNPYL